MSFEILFQFFLTTTAETFLPSHTQYNNSFQSSLMVIHSALYSDKLPCHSSLGILPIGSCRVMQGEQKTCLLSREETIY